MSGKNHHVHANIRKLGERTPAMFEAAGFVLDPFVECENSYTPPIHYSVECDENAEALTAWRSAVKIVEADPDFEGYIEFETLSPRFEAPIALRPYEPGRPFPLPCLALSDVPPDKHKHADLHVKRPASDTRDQLDADLTKAGFYEVQTERNRIYTLQCEDANDAREIFLLLRDFFCIAGGAKQVNFEVISKFMRKPKDLRLPRCLPRQDPEYWQVLRGSVARDP
jgi:hypothetical protein